MTDPRQPAYDAVFAHIGTLAAVLPADTAHRNAMIWRAVHVALDAGAAAAPCRTTQHCANHGWCHRCDPAFAATMSLVNVAIQRTDSDEQHWGLLYGVIGKALKSGEQPARTTPDNPVASSVALENTDICDSYVAPTEPAESGICARCGMYDWKHRGELARLRAEVARMREAGDHHIETANRLRAEVQRDRDQQAAVLREVLGRFRAGDGGAPEAWATREDLERWRSVVAPTVEQPWWEQVRNAEAALARVRAVVDRLTVGAPWAANQADIADRLQAALDGAADHA